MSTTRGWRRTSVALAAIVGLVAAGCGSDEPEETAEPTETETDEPADATDGTAEGEQAAGEGGECEELEPMKIGYTASGAMFTDVFVAKDMGFYEDHCIDAELIQLNSSSQLVPALVSGDVDIAAGDGTAFARSVLNGLEVTMVAVSNGNNILEFWADEEYEELPDLVGKKVGMTGPGSLGDTTFNLILEEFYPDLERDDFDHIALQGLAAMVAALESDAVEVVGILPPLGVQTRDSGHHVIFDASQMEHIASGTVATDTYLADNRDLVVRAVAATQDALEFIFDEENRDAVSEVIGKYSEVEELELNQYANDYFLPGWIPDMEIPMDTLEKMFEIAIEQEDLDVPDLDVTQYVDADVASEAAALEPGS